MDQTKIYKMGEKGNNKKINIYFYLKPKHFESTKRECEDFKTKMNEKMELCKK